jgi:molecular chaperone GrpE
MSKAKKIQISDESEVNELGRRTENADVGEDQQGDVDGNQTPQEELSEVELLEKRVDELNDKYLRSQAEMQNVVRRSSNEKAEAVKYANAELLRSVLGVMDDLDRTIEASIQGDAKPHPKVAAVVKGVEIVRESVIKLLGSNGVEVIEVDAGQAFDPTCHEAMMRQPADSPINTIVAELQRGYRYKDRVLRAAKVIVSSGDGDEQ